MWTYSKSDRMILHAESEILEAFRKFILAYFSDRMPGALEISQILGVPHEMVIQAMAVPPKEDV